MYGLINEGIRELVTRLAGAEAWEAISLEAGVEPEGFEPLCPYDDTLTFKLVKLTAEKLQLSQEEVLTRYGHYWITYTAESGYGDLMRLFGPDLRTCVANLNRMHAHMGSMMPALTPPRFTVETPSEDQMLVHYYSQRTGLAPMVTGLLQGLAEKYGDTISVTHIPKGERSDHDEFLVRFVQV
ncbi:MAG: hypothetical protein RL518_2427 [Pseudomonadota bacterium]|jgi:hypothetical protein